MTGAGAGDGGGPERGRNHRLPGVPPDDEEEKLRGRPDAGHYLLNFTCLTRTTEERTARTESPAPFSFIRA